MIDQDSFRRAQMAQLIKTIELYIGIESARVMGYVFFGRELNQAVADEVKPTMVKGAAAVQRLASFSPYIMGDQVCMADFFAYYIFLLRGRWRKRSGVGILRTILRAWMAG
ncbi:hypothetical protein N9N16_01030 [Porticoccaceae bacterium]|nr:hypothetical protein [Porticoccaceae bacterium]